MQPRRDNRGNSSRAAVTAKAANLLGALSLTLADKINRAVENELGIGGIAGPALIVIEAEPGITVEKLAKYLNLAQSSMVRAVQQLEGLGFVSKRTGEDRRVQMLHATRSGQTKARRILEARAKVLHAALDGLPAKETEALSRTVDRLIERQIAKPGDKFAICRLCDENACGEGDDCPAERSASAA
jgi:DNA-binding MarR family transcriptional regulator